MSTTGTQCTILAMAWPTADVSRVDAERRERVQRAREVDVPDSAGQGFGLTAAGIAGGLLGAALLTRFPPAPAVRDDGDGFFACLPF
jgi:hypothetical protein